MSGGGGDVVASEVRVNQLRKKLFNIVASPEKPTSKPRRAWRRRLSKENQTPCQPGFFKPFRGRRPKPSKHRKPSGEARGLPLFRYRTIRLERGDYVDRVTEARSFSKLPDPGGTKKTFVSSTPAASPSPGEAAMYVRPRPRASGIFKAGDVSRQALVSGRRSLPTSTSPPLSPMPPGDQPAEM